MFGYVLPDKNRLTGEEFTLYRAFYCGICLTLKKNYSNASRLFTTYDLTFLSVLSHDCLNYPVQFKQVRCVGGPVKKRVVVEDSPLLQKLCAMQLLLSKYKIIDDVIDGKKSRKALLCVYKKAFSKAEKEVDGAKEIIEKRYSLLREMEKSNETSIDKICDCFGMMMKELVMLIVGEETCDKQLLSLAYNIGKFVYLIDAIDDFDKDRKSGNYNPFIAIYGKEKKKKEFIFEHRKDVEQTLTFTINKAIASFNERKYNQSYSLLKNVIYYGLRKKADEVLDGKKQSKI